MKKGCFLIWLLLQACICAAQGFTFNRFTTDDGIGLSSNVVSSIHQDQKGFIWVGTANGLQRFDGRKFIQFNASSAGTNPLPTANLQQIIPEKAGRLLLAFTSMREFGIFDPANFSYKKSIIKTRKAIPAGASYEVWRTRDDQLYLTISSYGILTYNNQDNSFTDLNAFSLLEGINNNVRGTYEDTAYNRVWICTDSGLYIFDQNTRQLWNKHHNPLALKLLDNAFANDHPTTLFVDRWRRFWIFCQQGAPAEYQLKYCYDSTGSTLLNQDTLGLNTGPMGSTSYDHIYQTSRGDLWIYGSNVLYNYNGSIGRFQYHKSGAGNDNISINYEQVFQVMEDKDGGIWIATDQGLYFTSLGSNAYSVINLLFDNKTIATDITDLLEMPDGEFWFTSRGAGVKSVDKNFDKKENYVYRQPPPANWSAAARADSRNTRCISSYTKTGEVWIGCEDGILLVHHPAKKTTRYLSPGVFNNRTIRHLTEDKLGRMWLGTQGGRLIRYQDDQFKIMLDISAPINKVFVDAQGWIWISTHEMGFYAIDPEDGHLLQHYTVNNSNSSLYSNTGNDIEQLNDSLIVLGAGTLNFINKRSRKVQLITYADGLPSNSVERLRMDKSGFLWIITSNGLCRYNPINQRITPYGKKDGIVLAERTNVADLILKNGYLMFAGSNAMVIFHPSVYAVNQLPPAVTITDFKIFNQYQPIDSLLQHGAIRLNHDQNSISLYFASLSFMQRDRLTYYYKMEGIDKDWIRADKSSSVNYSLLPPGKYTFKVYCENIEGQRSKSVTTINIIIKPPFWATKWFMTTLLVALALVVYAVHDLRVKRLMAVEQLRNRVARDLHDDMGSTLSTINILSAMAKSKMSNDLVKTSEYLAKITDNSQRMMDAMDDIVWSIKPSNDSMQKIVARMREFATNVLEPKGIELSFRVEEAVYEVKLNMEARRDFFLIFKEAVNNAAKYSHANLVQLAITLQSKMLYLSVVDDGIGFDVKLADNGNGLGNMKKRSDALGGRLTIEADRQKGTKVQLKIPLSSTASAGSSAE